MGADFRALRGGAGQTRGRYRASRSLYSSPSHPRPPDRPCAARLPAAPRGWGSARLRRTMTPEATGMSVGGTAGAATAAEELRREIASLAQDGTLDALLEKWSPLSSGEVRSLTALRREEQ